MRKRIYFVLVCFLTLMCLAACGKSSDSVDETTTENKTTETIAADTTVETVVMQSEVNSTDAAVTETTADGGHDAATDSQTSEESTSVDAEKNSETTGTAAETKEETSAAEEDMTQQTTESAQAAVSVKAWDLLNNEPLNPTTSGYEELDRLVVNFFNELKNRGMYSDDMSPYQKVTACYDFFITCIVYSRGMDANVGQYSSSDPATTPVEVLWATDLLNTYQGCCYNYSSAFMYIMRYLGYDAHLITGQVGSYNGGTTPHCWLYVNLGGEKYTFDPDIDMNYYYRNGEKQTLFCRRWDDLYGFYVPETYHTN